MKLQLLLDEINKIKKEYDEQISKKGKNFNVFEILRIGHKENVHSNMIATLLNPEEKHDKGDLFLKLFFKYLSVENFDIKDVKIVREYQLPNGNGRVDIVIKNNKNQKIFIENKIYAGDQDKQLVRYNKCNPYKMFYLTLYGYDASKESKGKLEVNKDYYLLSYENEILDWLKECEKILEKENSLLKGTIMQYKILVEKLTGKWSKEMENKMITTLTKSEENIKSAFEIVQAIPILKEQIIKEKIIPIINKQKNLNFKVYENKKIGESYYGFSCRIEEKKLSLAFEFLTGNCTNLVYGIIRPNKDKEKEEYEKLINYLNQKNCKTDYETSKWPLCKKIDKYNNWYNRDFLEDILNCENSEIIKYIINKIEELLNIIKDYK